jgi:IS5 family transposase
MEKWRADILKGLKAKKKIPVWLKKLTAKERKHLKNTDTKTLTMFKANRKHQIEWEQKGNSCACWPCRIIAKKLGLE